MAGQRPYCLRLFQAVDDREAKREDADSGFAGESGARIHCRSIGVCGNKPSGCGRGRRRTKARQLGGVRSWT